MALIHYNDRDFDRAQDLFEELRERDPDRLELMDTYSNILFVKESKGSLSYLAHNAVKIDKVGTLAEAIFVLSQLFTVFTYFHVLGFPFYYILLVLSKFISLLAM